VARLVLHFFYIHTAGAWLCDAGVGLSIVKHIAEHHGGRVAIISSPDAGTTVECYFTDKATVK